MSDEKYMRLALRLARNGAGRVSPNPMVGALVVKGGKIVGKGYHRFFGGSHAEVYALRQAGKLARGATLYVNLEPCNHSGKTPPCTDAIIDAKVKRVVVGTRDPNPLNNGSGIRRLRRAGIAVDVGVCEEESKALNAPFMKYITTGLPYVTVKSAQSLDGKVATKTGESKWITSPAARRYVHKLRSEADAILVGVNTIIKDDPLLTARIRSPESRVHRPVKVILDSRLRTPLNARIFSKDSPAKVIIAVNSAPEKRIGDFEANGAEIISVPGRNGRVNVKKLMSKLAGRGIMNILIEGGGETIASALEYGIVDRFLFFISPKVIGGRDAKTAVEGEGIARIEQALKLADVKTMKFGEDIMIEGYVYRNN